jgi:hypothetical protein
MRKTDTTVIFPVELDMRPFISNSLCPCQRSRGFMGLRRGISALVPSSNSSTLPPPSPLISNNNTPNSAPSSPSLTTNIAAATTTTTAVNPSPPGCTCFIYDLFALVQHSGELGSGHYISFVKCGGYWFCFNDALISGVLEEDVINRQAYMLFYQRRQPNIQQQDGGE